MKKKFPYVLILISCVFAMVLPLGAQNLLEQNQSSQYQPQARSIPNQGHKYKLRAQDVLQLKVFQEPDLEKEVRVEADGTIVLSLIGKVKVGGLTISEAQLVIQAMYNKDYLVNPQVGLLVVKYYPQRVQVLGHVNNPGFVEILPESEMTLTKAISGANGFNLRANQKNVIIRRKFPNGETQLREVNVKEILDNPMATDPVVLDGDIIDVKESVF